MAIRQPFRFNSSVKEYQEITDFSKGMNTRQGDSILLDNTARNVENFDIEAGAILSKRKGITPIFDNQELATLLNINIDSLKDIVVIKSYHFKSGNFDIITLCFKYTDITGIVKYALLNNVMDKQNIIKQTVANLKEFTGTTLLENQIPLISEYGDKVYLIEKAKSDKNGNIVYNTTLKYWNPNFFNWLDNNVVITPSNLRFKVPYIQLSRTLSSTPVSFAKTGENGLLKQYAINFNIASNSNLILDNGIVNTSPFFTLDNQLYTNTITNFYMAFGLGVIKKDDLNTFIPPLKAVSTKDGDTSGILQGHIDTDPVSNPLIYIKEFNTYDLVTAPIFDTTSIETREKLLEEIRKNNYTIKAQCFIDVLKTSAKFPDVPSLGNNLVDALSITYTRSEIIIGSPNTSAEIRIEIGTPHPIVIPYINHMYDLFNRDESMLGQMFLPYFICPNGVSVDKGLSIDAEVRSSVISGGDISTRYLDILKPNPKTFSLLSYNLLTVMEINSLDDIDTTNISAHINITSTASTTHLESPIILNRFLPIVNKSLKIITPIAKSTTDTSQYHFGYTFIPLERWIEIQKTQVSAIDYVTNVVKTATWNPTIGDNVFNIIPTTSDTYVLSVYATSKDPATITTTTDYLQSNLNITARDSMAIDLSFDELKEAFFATDKSLSFKNQMFAYGNSNNIFISDVGNFGYFPLINSLQVPTTQDIVSITPYYQSLLVQTANEQFIIDGSTPQDFKVKSLNQDIGARSSNASVPNLNNIFTLTESGVYMTKSTFNFADRYNVERVDGAIMDMVMSDKDASAVVFNEKFMLHIPSQNTTWIYYNEPQWRSWIRYTGKYLNFLNMHRLGEFLVYVGKKGLALYVDGIDYVDKDAFGNSEIIVSKYKSKEIDFGLPNHSKKFKEMHIAFEDTPNINKIYINAWIDGTHIVDYSSSQITVNPNTFEITKQVVEKAQIETYPQSFFDNAQYDYSLFNNDVNQLHKVLIADKGKALQFEIIHKEPKQIKIRTFGFVIKISKVKALSKYA